MRREPLVQAKGSLLFAKMEDGRPSAQPGYRHFDANGYMQAARRPSPADG
jgi:hypothetical protein